MTSKTPVLTAPADDDAHFVGFRSAKGASRKSERITGAALYFVGEGSVAVVTDGHRKRIVQSRQMLILPPGTRYHAEVQHDNTLSLACRFDIRSIPGGSLPVENLVTPITHTPVLEIRPLLDRYLHLANDYLEQGLLCPAMQQVKRQELFLLLRSLYPDDELRQFFAPLFSEEMAFRDFVMRNWRDVRTADEIARRYGYSRTGFEQKFRQIYEQTFFSWQIERRAESLLADICGTTIPFAELAERHGFRSYERMWEFCRKHYGASPTELRIGGERVKK